MQRTCGGSELQFGWLNYTIKACSALRMVRVLYDSNAWASKHAAALIRGIRKQVVQARDRDAACGGSELRFGWLNKVKFIGKNLSYKGVQCWHCTIASGQRTIVRSDE